MSRSSVHRLPRSLRSALRAIGSQKGLTLIEIMVVMAVLGTLMTIIAVNVISKLDEANVDATKLQIKKIEGDLQLYAAKNKGKFPTTSDGLKPIAKYTSDQKVPTDAWGNEFQYFSPGTHGDHPYEIISLGKDGQEGGEDSNGDIQSWNMDGGSEE
jgi:general secretion pathway protein G